MSNSGDLRLKVALKPFHFPVLVLERNRVVREIFMTRVNNFFVKVFTLQWHPPWERFAGKGMFINDVITFGGIETPPPFVSVNVEKN